ncbi:uncharacterized protein AB675_6141 [Cyphellophora attinorum]|uniref:BTB domain-containing protein n=1 Tax=Cyphellophora attinorum TaxID=1664694 RepID=A0A0N1P3L0_9EURO|nr:uncharacterized protein AB675_6141 [Phialophora attinorum]KPI44123.1 hypothetical protein AB675_6141 [Phialophora attinorum]
MAPTVTTPKGIAQLKTTKRADFVIVCGDFEFKVHKIVVGSHSDFFERCIEGNFQESTSDKVELVEQEPEIVAMGLMYIYTGAYNKEDLIDVWPNLSEKVKLYMLAEFLLIDDLVKVVSDDLIGWLDDGDDSSSNNTSTWTSSADWTDKLSVAIKKATASQDLLQSAYEHMPQAADLRARTTIKALDFMKAAQSLSEQEPSPPYEEIDADNWGNNGRGPNGVWGPNGWVPPGLSDSEKQANADFEVTAGQLRSQVLDLQERLGPMFEQHDSVAYNVALHYWRRDVEHTDRIEDLERALQKAGIAYNHSSW